MCFREPSTQRLTVTGDRLANLSLSAPESKGCGPVAGASSVSATLRLMSHVFISYLRDDARRVDEFVRALKEAGVEVWLDRDQISPGQRWREAIRDAIHSGALFVACFSRAYALREKSHMHEEVLLAIEELRLRSTNKGWFVAVRIDDAEVPRRPIGGGETLHDLQWVDLATDWSSGIAQVVSAAKRSAERAKRERGRHNKDERVSNEAASSLRSGAALSEGKPRAQARPRKSSITERPRKLWFIALAIVLIGMTGSGWAIYKWASETALEHPSTATAISTVMASDITLSTGRSLKGLLVDYDASLTRFDNLPPINDAQRRCIETALSNAESRLSEKADGRLQDVERMRWDLNHCPATSEPSQDPSPIIAVVQALLTEEARHGRCSGLKPLPTDGVHSSQTSAAIQTYVRCHALALWQIKRLKTLGDYATIGLYLVQERPRQNDILPE